MSGDDQLLRLPDVTQLTGVSRSRIYLLMQSGEFPRSLKIDLAPGEVLGRGMR